MAGNTPDWPKNRRRTFQFLTWFNGIFYILSNIFRYSFYTHV